VKAQGVGGTGGVLQGPSAQRLPPYLQPAWASENAVAGG
jgi:hypothetical protein